MLDLTLLGTGGYMPLPNRYLSSLLLNYKGVRILCDCGEGTQIAMREHGAGFKNLDLILISHLHGDHFYGLMGVLVSLGNYGKTNPLTIIGPKGLSDMMQFVMHMSGKMPYEIRIIEEPKENFRLEHEVLKDVEISTMQLNHSIDCLGYSLNFTRTPEFCVEKAKENQVPICIWKKLQQMENVEFDGKTYTPNMVLGTARKGIKVSFIADTKYMPEIAQFVENSDVLVCEAMYGDIEDFQKAEDNKHMLMTQSAQIAKDGNVQTLILTHFSPSIEKPMDYDNVAKSVFPNSIIGTDGFSLTLRYNQ